MTRSTSYGVLLTGRMAALQRGDGTKRLSVILLTILGLSQCFQLPGTIDHVIGYNRHPELTFTI